MTEFARETYDEVIDDIRPLLSAHWRELALYQDQIPLDPDYDAYQAADRAGRLRIYTARENGRLIGYALFAVQERHAHYRHRWAVCDIIWIDPARRSLGNGNGLCDLFEYDLRAAGPIVIHIETKLQHPELAYLLNSRSYGPVGPSFSKRVA